MRLSSPLHMQLLRSNSSIPMGSCSAPALVSILRAKHIRSRFSFERWWKWFRTVSSIKPTLCLLTRPISLLPIYTRCSHHSTNRACVRCRICLYQFGGASAIGDAHDHVCSGSLSDWRWEYGPVWLFLQPPMAAPLMS